MEAARAYLDIQAVSPTKAGKLLRGLEPRPAAVIIDISDFASQLEVDLIISGIRKYYTGPAFAFADTCTLAQRNRLVVAGFNGVFTDASAGMKEVVRAMSSEN